MRKIVTKIICCTAALVAAMGLSVTTACSGVYNTKPLNYVSTDGKAVSNGGFAVEKGGYVYFINGNEQYTSENSFGDVVRGAIMRISKENLESRNYSSVDTVVPLITYSGNTEAGIFVYGDYVYYSTPSTEKNSDGEVQNSKLQFKRTKLDGTGTMKDYFVQLTDNTSQYRYVEVDGTVYLLYVVSESLYGTSCTNIHSLNTDTLEDTLLAYNVDSVIFDKADVTNPRVFYTMSVTDFELSTTSTYNQVYTVTADATEAADYSEYFNTIYEEDGYDPSTDPKYVNCGTLVFDGIGMIDGMMENITVFNHEDAGEVKRSAYTYSLSSYQNGVLFYTRSTSLITTASLYTAKVESEILAEGWNPVKSNDSAKYIIRDGSSASSYTYLFDGNNNISGVIIADSEGFIKTKLSTDGEIITDIDNEDSFYMTDKQPTVLFTANHDGDNYIYYSVDGGNGYTIYRICYDGNSGDYSKPFSDDVDKFTPVRILDLDASSDWYKPEIFSNQILFPSETYNMTDYPYIMVCDLTSHTNAGKMMTNAEIKELNDKYDGISEKIGEYDESEELYNNIQNALNYAFYTGDSEYIDTLIKAYVDISGYGEEEIWSKTAVAIYKDFVAAQNDWSEYAEDTQQVNGVKVQANKRDYYYTLLGYMSEQDAEAYADALKTTYLREYPVSDESWFESLSTGAKVGFIIGVCAGGLIIIGAAAVVTLVLIRKHKNKLPVYTKKRIKVDTTDDKNIDVYSDEQ